jgi:sugar phosphate isomerase/epimerase
MTIDRRDFFRGTAAAGLAGAMGALPAAAEAQTRGRARGVPAAPATMPAGSGGPGLANVWGEDFLYQWSPPENLQRDLTPGRGRIRLSGQQTPRLSGAEGTDYNAVFKAMREQGWSACEVGSVGWLTRKRPDSEIREIKAAAKANDIRFYGLHCGGNIIAPGPDAERWQRHIIDSVHAAEEVGCELILTHAGSNYPSRDMAHPMNWSRETWMRTVGALKRICKDTAGSKVDVAIEAVNTESVNNPWAHKRLREDVGDARLTVGLDLTNMVFPNVAFRMTEHINTVFDLLGDQIRYIHAKDFVWNGMLPGMNWALQGTGNMDYETFLVRISRLNREIPLLIEFLTQDEEYQQAQRNIRSIASKLGVQIHGTQQA